MNTISAAEKIAALRKQDPTIMIGAVNPYEICPTRIPELNALLPGGFVKGKVCLLYGSPSAGKSTTCVETIADEMAKDPEHVCLLIPSERGEDLPYYQKLGLDMDRTATMRRPKYILEEVLYEIDKALSAKSVNSILIDSWDGLVGYKELYTPDGKEKDATKDTVAAKAAGASKMWKRIKGLIADRNVLFLIVAQTRTKGLGSYIVTEGYAGGFALEHNIDIGVQQNFGGLVYEQVDGQKVAIGQKIKIKLAKSKVNANAHKTAESIFIFGKSWDQLEGLWNASVASGIIEKHGGWYSYPGFPVGKNGKAQIQGEATARQFFSESTINRSNLKVLVDYAHEHATVTKEDLTRLLSAQPVDTAIVADEEINEPEE